MSILDALRNLDPADDDQWTSDGLPRVEVVREIVGHPDLTRAAITDAAPQFTRETAILTPPEPPTTTPEPSVPDTPSEAVDHAHVPICDEVVGMNPSAVLRDLDLIDRALQEFNRQHGVLAERREAIDLKLREIGARIHTLSARRERMVRPEDKRKAETDSRRAYLDRQIEERNKRAERLRRIQHQGITQQDVEDVFGGSSKLDAVMARKTGWGNTRPQSATTATGG